MDGVVYIPGSNLRVQYRGFTHGGRAFLGSWDRQKRSFIADVEGIGLVTIETGVFEYEDSLRNHIKSLSNNNGVK